MARAGLRAKVTQLTMGVMNGAGPLTITTGREGDGLHVQIADTGPGREHARADQRHGDLRAGPVSASTRSQARLPVKPENP